MSPPKGGRGRPAKGGAPKGAPKGGAQRSGPAKRGPAKGAPAKGASAAKGGPRGAAPAGRRGPAKPAGPPRRGRGPVGRGEGQRGTTPLRHEADSTRRGLGGEQVEGRHAVFELLLAGTRRTREVLFAADMDAAPILDDIKHLAHELKVPLREIGRGKFEAMARTDAPQGVLATAAPLREHELDDLARPGADGQPPFLLLVDGVTDPGNLGALLRSAECAGVTGVVLPRHRAAHITPTVTKSAAGAVERLRLTTVAGLPTAIARLAELGVWTVGLDAEADESLFEFTLANEPVALVLGAEGAGLSQLVRKRCDTLVSIPLRGRLNSLNVSVAGALACYEITRRRELARNG
jgi:23S rRNA (guanosine2251-2'-O)-methyltransferase